ncbi:hypothetical protein AKG43_10335 [Neisseria sp. 74A18]|nr:hypothetical protein AKG43_10335 [Neisseria sp. 74A18]
MTATVQIAVKLTPSCAGAQYPEKGLDLDELSVIGYLTVSAVLISAQVVSIRLNWCSVQSWQGGQQLAL